MGEIDVSQREHHPAGNCRPGGCFRVTVNKWVKEWGGLKAQSPADTGGTDQPTLTQLDELDRSIAKQGGGQTVPSAAEADIRRKLTADLEALEQDASIRDIYNVSRGLLDWLRQQDLERAKGIE